MNDLIIKDNIDIKELIYEIRGQNVMLDSDVAKLFNYTTKNLNRNVKNNINRFPEQYCFQLTEQEYKNLRCKNFTSSLNTNYGGRRYLPYAFNEYGIVMLSGILKSDIAVSMSIRIVNEFIFLKKYISNDLIEQRFYKEMLIRHDNDIKFLQESFDKLSEKEIKNDIYFDGQIYDAYSKILDIFKKSKKELIIIDSYTDKITLDIISRLKVKVIIITSKKGRLTKLDIEKYNKQYSNLNVIYDDTFHDRYFIIDKNIIYHCGTSLNYIGLKTFCINILDDEVVKRLILNKIIDIEKKYNHTIK